VTTDAAAVLIFTVTTSTETVTHEIVEHEVAGFSIVVYAVVWVVDDRGRRDAEGLSPASSSRLASWAWLGRTAG
jgi:hypothetical protein